MKLKLEKIAQWLLVIGAINWGLVGLLGGTIFSILGIDAREGLMSQIEMGTYVAIGVAGLIELKELVFG
jgi:uncharacterized membrane protein YuzA (DUF378 family)